MEITKADILQQLDHPARLEQMYRENKSSFRRAFREAYADAGDHLLARAWHERLEYAPDSSVSWGTGKDWWRVIALCLVAGTLAKLPDVFSWTQSVFFTRNASLLVFPFLMVYFAWKNGFRRGRLAAIAIICAASAAYVNLLPKDDHSDTLVLALIFLPVFIWSLLGLSFSGTRDYDQSSRFDFLNYTGDFLVMSAILFLSFSLFSALTIGLFKVVGVDIEHFYGKYFAIYCVFSAPIVATHLVRTNPQLVNKISPVIAKVFTPLLLLTLTGYLIAFAVSDKDPYNDRDFLFIFNMLLLGVMAIIFFSVVEAVQGGASRFGIWSLFLLSSLATIVNAVATSAIAYRFVSMGITPNRLALLGSNLLFLGCSLLLTFRLFHAVKQRRMTEHVANGITLFLPSFGIWAFIVTFLFPALFGFR